MSNKTLIVVGFVVMAVLISFSASATVYEPNPALSVEAAFNTILGSNSAYQNVSYLFRGTCAAAMLLFAAWATFGIFEAHFVDKQISMKAAVWLFIRLLIMTSITMILINL